MKEENGMTATPVEPIVMRSSRVTATLYLGDCLDLLPIEADAVVTDPPYGMAVDSQRFDGLKPDKYYRGENGRTEYAACEWDAEPFDASKLLAVIPKSKPLAMWGADFYRETLPAGGGWLVWDKKMPGMEKTPGSEFELCWTRQPVKRRVMRYVWTGYLAKEKDEDRKHPTQKPVAVMAWLMESLRVSAGATVLDPYMGSGTTGVACVRSGRNFIGVEKDEKYFKIAVERIRRELAQGRMF